MRRGRTPFRASSFFRHTERAGVDSVPLVGLVSFFLGLTMALLTGYQLQRFGTERLVPGLVAIAFTRELGPLITGIMLAARIGAAFTAELGTMQVSEEVEAIEAIDGRLQCKLAACHLKPLHQVGGAREQHAPAVLHQDEANGGSKVRLPAAWSTDEEQIGALADPAVPGTDRQDMRLGDHRHHVEVEAVEGFPGQQLRLREMASEAAAVTLGDFVLGKHGEEARGGPGFLVRALGKG